MFQPVLTAAGLLIQGTLWRFEYEIGCQEDRLLFTERYQKHRNSQVGEEIFFHVLAELQKSDLAPLAKALFSEDLRSLLEPAIPTSPRDPDDHSDTNRMWWVVDRVMTTGTFHIAVPQEKSPMCQAHEETFVLFANPPQRTLSIHPTS